MHARESWRLSRRKRTWRHVFERTAPARHLAPDEARDGLGLVARGLGGEQRGARLDPIEHQQAEAEREGADDARQRQEDLHADATSPRARAHEPLRR